MRMVGISLLPERTEQFVATEMQERRRLLSTATRGWPTPSGDGRRGNFKERRGSRRIFARTNPMFVSIGARSRVLGRASPPRLVPGTRRGPPHASVRPPSRLLPPGGVTDKPNALLLAIPAERLARTHRPRCNRLR
jgi:hypothetical protein